MWFFVDESWSPNDSAPKFGVLLGVLIKDEQLEKLDKFMFSIRKKYFGSANARNRQCELKGKDLLSSYVVKMFKPANAIPNNICVIKEMLSYPITEPDFYLKVIASTVYSMNKEHPKLLSPDPRELAEPFRRLIENVSAAASEDVPGRKVTLVFDQRIGAQKDIAISIYNYVAGMKLKNVESYPYFAVSNVSPGVQFADVLAYLLSKRAQQKREIFTLFYDMKKLCWESKTAPKKYGLMLFDEKHVKGKAVYTIRKKW